MVGCGIAVAEQEKVMLPPTLTTEISGGETVNFGIPVDHRFNSKFLIIAVPTFNIYSDKSASSSSSIESTEEVQAANFIVDICNSHSSSISRE